jgi:hypothetical protein
MRRVLIISPHFAPVNAPDMQRVRLALPHLKPLGWEPTVLALAPESVEAAVLEPLLESTYPADVRVIRVRGVSPRVTRRFGFGGLWLRCGRALASAGERLLRRERFDLVFFSTTQFGAFALGPRWRREFGVPYVLDFQDPWVNDHYARTGQRPPGGSLKFALAQWRARRTEPAALRGAAGIVSVSAAYARDFAARYPWFDPARVHEIPFGAAEGDLAIAREHQPARPLIPFGDGCIHHVYTGRGGADMAVALTLLFRALRRFRTLAPERAARVRFHFIGTSYAPPALARESIRPVAVAEGVADLVHEHPARVPYFDALHYLARADAVLALGSDDPGYSASKLYPCVMSRRPLLALFHESSPVHALLRTMGATPAIPFRGADDERVVGQIAQAWFLGGGMERVPAFDATAFAPFTAEGMTRRLTGIFDTATSRA